MGVGWTKIIYILSGNIFMMLDGIPEYLCRLLCVARVHHQFNKI